MGYFFKWDKHLTGNLKTLIQILVLFLGNSFVLGSMLCSPLTNPRPETSTLENLYKPMDVQQ